MCCFGGLRGVGNGDEGGEKVLAALRRIEVVLLWAWGEVAVKRVASATVRNIVDLADKQSKRGSGCYRTVGNGGTVVVGEMERRARRGG